MPKSKDEVAEFRLNTHVLIATPSWLWHLADKIDIGLKSVKLFIADEADTLFDLGFFEDANSILQKCTNRKLQRCYFSATMQPAIEEVLKQDMPNYVKVIIGVKNAASKQIA